MTSLVSAFSKYEHCSGSGSTVEYTAPYREFLSHFIEEHRIESILDLGCGDLEVMSRVLFRAAYVGVDCLPNRVRANKLAHPELPCVLGDVRTWTIGADLVICKDVLQHWPTADILEWLDAIPATRYALLVNCARGDNVNGEISLGGWRPLDLAAEPFVAGRVVFSWDTKDVVLIDMANM